MIQVPNWLKTGKQITYNYAYASKAGSEVIGMLASGLLRKLVSTQNSFSCSY